MSKKKKHGGKKLTARELQIEILRFLLQRPKKQYAPQQIVHELHVENNKDAAEYALQQLAKLGSVTEFSLNRYGITLDRFVSEEEDEEPAENPTQREEVVQARPTPREKQSASPSKNRKVIEGRVDMTRTGSAYIISDQMDSDIYVPQKHINGAMNGDTVQVLLFPPPPARRRGMPSRKPEGEILQVLKRANEIFLGTIRFSRKYAMFLPDNPNIQTDIYVPLEACGEAADGDKVVVAITDWQEGKGRVPIGKVTQVLGTVGGNDFEMKKILINYGFPLQHTEEAEAEAARIPDTISPQEIERRHDFRDVLTFTIDPEDAKDFDDALSVRTLENGNLEVGVHIADVTHYLKPGSPMDKEAFARSTSVYLVDRCNPMLPEKLSNNLCSLVPEQDRLTFSAVFEFDSKDNLVKRWFGKTVIYSDKRFSYEEAQTVLDKKPAPELKLHPLFGELEKALFSLNRISGKMRKEREKNGAIGFETDEVRFRLDENGVPMEAYVKERKEAHLLIEDFMLLANKEVALYMHPPLKPKKGDTESPQNNEAREIPFIFRVHDLPDMSKVIEFARFAAEMGHPMKVDTPKQIAESFNKLMVAARKDDRLKILEPLAIRTMAKAVYSSNNIGHYGLGFSHYSHFTSPIRRYSDVLAHRILEQNLDRRTYRMDKAKLEEQCKHISNQEKKAADAERESIKYKQAEFLKKHVGDVFEGIVSGIIDRGFFVELPDSRAEGLVEFRYLDDTYTIDPGNLSASGRRYKKQIRMGDRVNVRVVSVDMNRRQIEMDLA
jgi:ribonuclease R